MSDSRPGAGQVLIVGGGRPTDEELAALVTVLSALATPGEDTGSTAAQRVWASPAARLRTAAYGPVRGGWRASGLPR